MPHEFDHERRLVRYRAKAHICNGCPRKAACTDSDRGREIVRPLDPWPHSEAGRFHRAISLLMVALAALILVVEAARHHEPPEAALLLGLLAARGARRALAAARPPRPPRQLPGTRGDPGPRGNRRRRTPAAQPLVLTESNVTVESSDVRDGSGPGVEEARLAHDRLTRRRTVRAWDRLPAASVALMTAR